MTENAKVFKRRFFGGFDRHDVIEYIEKLASERNRFHLGEERLETECEKLRGELENLQAELQKADAFISEIGGDTIENAEPGLAFDQNKYIAVRDGILQTTGNIQAELQRLEGAFDTMSLTIELVSGCFNELKQDLSPIDIIPA